MTFFPSNVALRMACERRGCPLQFHLLPLPFCARRRRRCDGAVVVVVLRALRVPLSSGRGCTRRLKRQCRYLGEARTRSTLALRPHVYRLPSASDHTHSHSRTLSHIQRQSNSLLCLGLLQIALNSVAVPLLAAASRSRTSS